MGVPCLGVWRDPRMEFGRHSRYLLRSIQVPAAPSRARLVEALDELTTPWREAKPALIPASDLYAEIIDEAQDDLRSRYTLRCSERRLHAAFADKATTIDLCSEADVPIPRSLAIGTAGDVTRVGCEFRFPVIVKPRRTHGIEFPGKNFVVDSSEEFVRFFERRPGLVGQTVTQEVVPSGDGRILGCISYSGRDGRVLARMTFRKRRQWPPDYGVTCLGRSEWIPEIASISERLLNRVGYQGFAAIEFAEHAETGRRYLLEVNPRLSLPIQLALDAGIDLFGIAWREMNASGPLDATPPEQIDGVHWIDLRRDLMSMIHKYRRNRIGLSEWVRSIAPVSSHASYDLRDPKPWLASSGLLIREVADLLGRHLRARLGQGGR